MFILLDIDSSSLQSEHLHIHTENNQYHLSDAASRKTILGLQQRNTYPATFAKAVAGGFVFGYGTSYAANDDFLRISLSRSGLTIERDYLATLPLFYAYDNGRLIVSNLYQAVVDRISTRSVDNAALADSIRVAERSRGHTYIHEIKQLVEREALTFDGRSVEVTLPGSRPWVHSSQVPPQDPQGFLRRLDQRLEEFYQTKLQGQIAAFQVSGGLDSATLPLYLSSRPAGHLLATVQLPGEAGMSQRTKLTALQQKTGYECLVTEWDEAADYPLAAYIQAKTRLPFSQSDDITYNTTLNRHITQLAGRGVTILATGIGGDDVFEHIPDSVSTADYLAGSAMIAEAPPYATDRLPVATATATSDIHPTIPTLPQSLQSITTVHNTYIEAGIWPASPFLDYDFYVYCQGLPAHFKHNKNILRAYHQAKGFEPAIYNPGKGESLAPLLNDFIASDLFARLLNDYARVGYAAKHGLIDVAELTRTYTEAVAQSDNQWLFPIFELACAELSLAASSITPEPTAVL